MSLNMYSDQSPCTTCATNTPYTYTKLKNLTNYECDQQCLCRNTSERSTKDRMDYDVYVLNQNIQLPLQKVSNGWRSHTYEENNTL